MKKIFLALVISCITLTTFAQSDRSLRQDEWLINVGFNTINSLGSKNPFKSPGDWAFRFPLAFGAETRWSELFTLEIALSLNGFAENAPLDAVGPPSTNETYIALDTSLKYYFGEYIFPRTEWIDFYGNAGLGVFSLDGANISANIGGGALFWLNRNNTFGFRLQGIGKFALNHSDNGRVYANNHFQYSLQLVFKL